MQHIFNYLYFIKWGINVLSMRIYKNLEWSLWNFIVIYFIYQFKKIKKKIIQTKNFINNFTKIKKKKFRENFSGGKFDSSFIDHNNLK